MSTLRTPPALLPDLVSLVAGLGHELRGPLGVIVGGSELLLEEMEDGEGREAWRGDLRGIHASGMKLGAILEALVDLARLESGQAPLAPAPTALLSVVKEAAAEHHGRGARLAIVSAGEAATVAVDARRLRRAVAMALDAAIERAGVDPVTVSVTQDAICFDPGASAPPPPADDARLAIAALLCARLGVQIAQRGAALVWTVRPG